MTTPTAIPTAAVRLREAVREAAVLALVSVALALFYNGVTGKGVFADLQPPAATVTPGSAPEIIPLEKAASLHREGTALFVDSRHDFDFRLGHITGALSAPLKEADAVLSGLREPKDRPVVVYCDGAECNSSLEVGAKFSAAGYTHVYVFFAGWTAWKEAGLPRSEGTP